MGFPVKCYVYEISGGMAQAMSMGLLGKQIEGIWHTGIVVYGKEYFFGSFGIEHVPFGQFMLGNPTEVVGLGETEIPEELFHEYLNELGSSTFAGSTYHLLNHNCNNFSHEVGIFLTGNGIPEKIINLPNEVMSTSFGQMLLPFIDSMMMQFNQNIHSSAIASGENTHHGNDSTAPTTSPTTSFTSTATSSQTTLQNGIVSNQTSTMVVKETSQTSTDPEVDPKSTSHKDLDLD